MKMKKLTLLIAMLMATSAWAEWTKTCKSEDGTYSETASLLYDNKNWSYTQQKYREGKKYTIKFSTLTNLQPPLGGISSRGNLKLNIGLGAQLILIILTLHMDFIKLRRSRMFVLVKLMQKEKSFVKRVEKLKKN